MEAWGRGIERRGTQLGVPLKGTHLWLIIYEAVHSRHFINTFSKDNVLSVQHIYNSDKYIKNFEAANYKLQSDLLLLNPTGLDIENVVNDFISKAKNTNIETQKFFHHK